MSFTARRFAAFCAALAVVVSLGGCVVVPEGGYYHHRHWDEGYHRGWYR